MILFNDYPPLTVVNLRYSKNHCGLVRINVGPEQPLFMVNFGSPRDWCKSGAYAEIQ